MKYRRLNPAEKLINKVFNKKSMISDEQLEIKMRSFSKPTLSYFLLLTSSIIIATLGLLMDASAIVIGSMIISPLTWPMFGLADGAALGNQKRIQANILLLIGSVLLGIALAYLLTILSPLKVVNDEILARSRPTLLDAVVAITAGGIGTLAIVRKNISDSIAGVAVALSLTPPMCVFGISLALGEMDIVKGSFLLMLTNALSITLVAGVMLVLIHYSWRRKLRMAPKAFIIMAVSLLLTAIPLYRLLNEYSLETSSYAVVQTQLNSFIESQDNSGASSVQNIRTNLEEQSGTNVLVVSADMFLPPSVSITYQEKDTLVKALERDLGRIVDLRLRLQSVTLLANASDIQNRQVISNIESELNAQLQDTGLNLTLNDVQIVQNNGTWGVSAQVNGYLDAVPTESQIKNIEIQLAKNTSQKISLNVQFSPLIQIQADDVNNANLIYTAVSERLSAISPSAVVQDVEIDIDDFEIRISILLPANEELSPESADYIKHIARTKSGNITKIRLIIRPYTEL